MSRLLIQFSEEKLLEFRIESLKRRLKSAKRKKDKKAVKRIIAELRQLERRFSELLH